MYRFLQKHGKKIMAIFGVFLMISFALPTAYQYGQGGGNPVIGTIGDGEKLRAQELFEARRSWEMLSNLGMSQESTFADILGPTAVAQIREHPVLFLLLQKEAERLGVAVNNDVLESIVRNSPGLIGPNEDRNAAVRQAVADLLLVRQGFARAASAIKVPDALVQHELAETQQSITLGAVQFSTAQYADKVPAPTAEQLRAQFEKYADNTKGSASESNPFGFGYRYPDRVKLQYITVPRSDVRKAVEAAKTKDAYAFTVEAQRYYQQNKSQFPSTQPATAASDALSLGSGGATRPAATAPTTRPFSAVEQEIKDQLIESETDRRLTAITERITQQMANDWSAYNAAAPKGAATAASPATGSAATESPATQPSPTTAASTRPAFPGPATALGAPYATFGYLKNLAAVIQKDFGVLPTVVSKADTWLSQQELQALAGIGQATMGGVPMADYLMSMAAPFVPAEQRDEMGVIQVLEPTRPLHDSANSVYIARLTEAQPSHKPATLSEVEAAVRNDVITARAFELAKADATKLLEQARQQGLAAAGGERVVNVGPLTQRQGQVVPTLNLSGEAAFRFVDAAFKLLSTPTSRPSGKPVRLIELPQDGRVVVAELGNVEAMWNERTRPIATMQIRETISQTLAMQFAQQWFDYDAVASRLNFIPNETLQQEPAGPPPPRPPMF